MNLQKVRPISWAPSLSAGILALAVACSGGDATSLPAPQPASQQVSAAEDSLQVALASTDLSVGRNRVVFALIDPQSGPIRGANVQVSTYFLPSGGREGPIESATAVFREWPVRPGGIYTVELTFDRPGNWGLVAEAIDADGVRRPADTGLRIKETSSSPALGGPAPKSESKTLSDVEDIEQVTSDRHPDRDLYEKTIAEAIESGRPLMLTFSTPAFCQSATCGPQLDVVKGIKKEFGDRAEFIHIEVFDNPHLIEGNIANGVLSPTLAEWGLVSEPWTFVIDGDGLVSAKFETFTTRSELEEALAAVLE